MHGPRSLVALLLAAAPVHAADVDIHVTDSFNDGPVSGAAVCLGTPANPSQFGAQSTGADGIARFLAVPETGLVLTISKTQFRSLQRSLSAHRSDRAVLVYLLRGGGGPRCSVPGGVPDAATPSTASTLVVADCSINGGEYRTGKREVTLRCSVDGRPTHYHVSERSDFGDAEWKPYQPAAAVELSPGRGTKTLYYQVRRFSAASGATLQTESNIAQDSIYLDTR